MHPHYDSLKAYDDMLSAVINALNGGLLPGDMVMFKNDHVKRLGNIRANIGMHLGTPMTSTGDPALHGYDKPEPLTQILGKPIELNRKPVPKDELVASPVQKEAFLSTVAELEGQLAGMDVARFEQFSAKSYGRVAILGLAKKMGIHNASQRNVDEVLLTEMQEAHAALERDQAQQRAIEAGAKTASHQVAATPTLPPAKKR